MKEIVFYDSGIGGISIMNEARKRMKREHFVYFADNLNVPYGELSCGEIIEKAVSNLECEIKTTTKAVVIACNTITSQGIGEIRKHFSETKIIGIEPETKSARTYNFENTLLIATPKTCEVIIEKSKKNDKYKNITIHPAKSLASTIEREIFNKEAIYREIVKIKKSHNKKFEAVVLGCTHYALVKDVFRYAFGDCVHIFDGVSGTANNLFSSVAKEESGFGSLRLILTKEDTVERLKYARLIH